MIHKSQLPGKFIAYWGRGRRLGKVIKVEGNFVTVKSFRQGIKKKGMRIRIHKKNIIGRQLKNKVEDIDWKKVKP